MICKACGKENPLRADYCHACGHPFSKEEQQEAYDATVYGKIDKVREAKEWITLDKITSHPVFRVLVIAGIILLGWFSHSNQGSVMKLLESDEYTIAYNETLKEYYLYSDLDSVHVQLYLPGKPKGIRITELNADGSEGTVREYRPDEQPVLLRKTPFYKISGIYEDAQQEILVGVYETE